MNVSKLSSAAPTSKPAPRRAGAARPRSQYRPCFPGRCWSEVALDELAAGIDLFEIALEVGLVLSARLQRCREPPWLHASAADAGQGCPLADRGRSQALEESALCWRLIRDALRAEFQLLKWWNALLIR